MTTQFADRAERVEPSATLAISNLAADREVDDVDAVGLQFGREVADGERRARFYAFDTVGELRCHGLEFLGE